jgi:hypothetical protein
VSGSGGEPISPRTKHASFIKTEPAAYSLSNTSISQSYSAKSPIANDFQPVRSCDSEIIGQSMMPCSQCFHCQNNQQCEGQGAYFNNYSTAMDHGRVSAVLSASGLLATHVPNTLFPQAGLDSVIETYMRNMLHPDAFIPPRQSLSPSAQPQEPMTASFWDANIDPNLPSLNPAVSQIEFHG